MTTPSATASQPVHPGKFLGVIAQDVADGGGGRSELAVGAHHRDHVRGGSEHRLQGGFPLPKGLLGSLAVVASIR